MISSFTHRVIADYSYLQVYALTTVYFLLLYFIIGPLFLGACKLLKKTGLLHAIHPADRPNKNRFYEIKNSFRSILIFGFSSLPLIYFVRNGFIVLLPDSLWATLAGLVVLIIWNEIHFFVVHCLMHLRIFYKHIHYMHHVSKIPTVYSVFSFHPVEAVLLSSVEFTIALFLPFSATAIFLYPLVSILLNYAGHCNYRFGKGSGSHWRLFGTRHAAHHYKNAPHYGFASTVLDQLIAFQKKNK